MLHLTGALRDVLAAALGVVTGLLSGAFGIGGAVISTPGVRLLGASALVAVGTTLPSILPGAVSGTIRYARDRLVNWKVVAAAAPAGAVAAVAGSLLSHRVPGEGRWLMVVTAAIVGVTAYRMSRPPPAEGTATAPAGPRLSRPLLAAVGGSAGLLSGLLGLGGGLVLVPGFNQLLRLPLKETVATSLACVGILAVPGTVTHAFLGDIDWRLALFLAAGVVPGARLGASMTIRTSDRRLRLAVGGCLGAVAVVYGVTELAAALR